MAFDPQNWANRLSAAGKSIEEKAAGVSAGLVKNVKESANIDVNGLASAIEGAASEFKGASVDLGNSLNGLTGLSINDTISSGLNGIANNIASGLISSFNPLFGGGMIGQLFNGGVQDNPLAQFASSNYEITLGCLTPFELNFPDFTYRNRDPFFTIIRSSGGTTRGSAISAEVGGKTEYFIDDIEIDSIIAPNAGTRLTNATSFNFTVTEPYSMGNFLQALQVAALSSGHKNYIDAPYVLIVQFKGWDDFGRPITVPNTRRVFPLKFVDIRFEVSEGGSTYSVQAIPFNEIALSDENQSTHTDTQMRGRTVAEMLQTGGESLSVILNNRELKKVQAGQQKIANQYVIMFPNDLTSSSEGLLSAGSNNAGATTASSFSPESDGMRELTEEQKQRLFESITGITDGEMPEDFDAELQKIAGVVVRRSQYGEQIRDYAEKEENLNVIGSSPIVKSNLDAGTQPMATPKLSEDEDQPGKVNRCQVGRSQDTRCMTFSPGKRIQDIIEQVITSSEYGRKIVEMPADQNGMVDWFRIDARVYLVPGSEQVDISGEQAKVFVYRVVPYKVHKSVFQGPTQTSPGIASLKRNAAKEYNYIYTGKNDDILNFDIRFDYAFFASINGDLGQLGLDSKQGFTAEMANGNARAVPAITEGTTNKLADGKTKAKVPTANKRDGGGIAIHPENQIAFNFNEALVNSPVDLVMVDLEVVGDPYFIADSGMGNYDSRQVGLNIDANGALSYQTSEVDIVINFRTPLDYGPDGYMEFPGLGSQPVKAFSGLYKVLFVKNVFSKGEFTQVLQTTRRRAQDLAAELAAVQSGGAVELADASKQISKTPNVTESGGTTGTTGFGQGQVDPSLNRAVKANESRRIENVLSARANGANIGF